MKRLFLLFLVFSLFTIYEETKADYSWIAIYWKVTQKVNVFDREVKVMINRDYTPTMIIDLLTIRAMECDDKDWLCIWKTHDIWHFQINQIHKKDYKTSKKLYWTNKLFRFQLSFAYSLVDNANKKYCYPLKDNNKRFKCVAKTYNWWWSKIYPALALIKRKQVKEYLKSQKYYTDYLQK